MKKILLLALIVCSVGLKAQSPVDYDSISATTAPSNAMYGLVFDNATKTIYSMTMDYYQPWLYSGGLLRARSIGDNVIVGSTANTYSDKFFVNGTSTVSGNLFGMGRIYVGAGRSSYIYAVGNQLYFYSPTTGIKSLADIGSGGALTDVSTDTLTIGTGTWDTKIFGLNSILNFQVAGSSAFAIQRGASGLFARTYTDLLRLTPQSTSFLSSFTVGEGDMYYNTVANKVVVYNGASWDTLSTGSGTGVVDSTVHTTGQLAIWTSSNAIGGDVDLSFTGGNTLLVDKIVSDADDGGYVGTNGTIIGDDGYALFVENSSGYGAYVNGYTNTAIMSSATTGESFIGRHGSSKDTIVIISDSLRVHYFGDVGSSGDVWLTLTNTKALDTCNTENVAWIGLVKPIPPIKLYYKNQKKVNGHMELEIDYVDNQTKTLKSQYGWGGLGMMETQSAYQIFHEKTVRYLVEQDEKITELEKKLNQNKRSALKRKVKDLEQRLETIEKLLSFSSGTTTLEHRR